MSEDAPIGNSDFYEYSKYLSKTNMRDINGWIAENHMKKPGSKPD